MRVFCPAGKAAGNIVRSFVVFREYRETFIYSFREHDQKYRETKRNGNGSSEKLPSKLLVKDKRAELDWLRVIMYFLKEDKV